MFQFSLRWVAQIGLGTFFVFGAVPSAAGVARQPETQRCDQSISVTPIQSLSIDELSKLGPPIEVVSDFGGMTYRPFDEDERPRKKNRIELGMILVRSGDLGGKPFGALVMTSRRISVYARQDGSDQLLISTTNDSPCRAEIRLRLTSKGEVMLGDAVVGRAQ